MTYFKSKNGPMLLHERNVTYAIESLQYNIGKLVAQLIPRSPIEERGHVISNLFGPEITQDMYIVALLLHSTPDGCVLTIPCKINGLPVYVGPNLAVDIKTELNLGFVKIANSNVFNTYIGAEYGDVQPYSSMSPEHKLNAIARRISLLPFMNKTVAENITRLENSFNMPVLKALDSEVDSIYSFLKGIA